ncbi:hypothetical protein [Massilia cavernae]|uniref:hypothetical protein n=1 Tax=Massilia cavernae TaxID=2320864 RepID=UPI0011C4261A|nr:hypothetical protein [Massilia cavernae]
MLIVFIVSPEVPIVNWSCCRHKKLGRLLVLAGLQFDKATLYNEDFHVKENSEILHQRTIGPGTRPLEGVWDIEPQKVIHFYIKMVYTELASRA